MGKHDLSEAHPCKEDLVVVNHNTVEKNVRKVLDVLDCRNRIWTKEEKANVSEAFANLVVDEPVAIVDNILHIGKNAIREPIKRFLNEEKHDDHHHHNHHNHHNHHEEEEPKPHDNEEDECEHDKPKPKPQDKPKPKPEDKPKPKPHDNEEEDECEDEKPKPKPSRK